MIDKNQLKTQGLTFGRNLQRAYRIVMLYTPEHAAAQDSLQQAYTALNLLLKLTPQFTFGFYNQRVLLNDLLTADSYVAALQEEFFKRSIAAVTFSLGITFREFKRALGVIATKPETIEAAGGIGAFLRKNPVEGARVVPEEKRPLPGDQDAVLGMDLQSYLVTQALFEGQPGQKTPGLEMLFQAVGTGAPEGFKGSATEILELAGKAAQAAWADPKGNPNTVVQALARLIEDLSPEYLMAALPLEKQERYRGRPAQEIAAEMAEDMAVEWAAKRLAESSAGSVAGGSGGSAPGGSGDGAATGSGGSGTGESGGSGGAGAGGSAGGESGGAATAQSAALTVEQDVARVLERTLKTTQVAQRLLQKLGSLVKEAQLPEEVVQRIQKELMWSTLPPEEKHVRLKEIAEFTDPQFQRLVEYVEEKGKVGDAEMAAEVGEHYLACLDACPVESRTAAVARLPRLLQALGNLSTPELDRALANRLGAELLEEPLRDWNYHREVAGSLAGAAQHAAKFEGFDTTLKIGLDLERSLERDKARHADCCGAALKNLLPSASVERLVELSLRKNNEVALARTLATLLRLVGMQTAEIVMQILEGETNASSRGRLIRLAGQLGSSAFEAARKRLQDERWFVVRNACNILGALNDPELAAQLEPAFRHPDDRVRQAAIATVIKSKVPDRGSALAQALPHLQPHLQEAILNELIMMKDPATIQPIGEFILLGSDSKTGILEKAAQVLAVIPDERTVEALGRILYDAKQPLSLRRVALSALKSSPFPLARQRLDEFPQRSPSDPLAEEYRKTSTPKAG